MYGHKLRDWLKWPPLSFSYRQSNTFFNVCTWDNTISNPWNIGGIPVWLQDCNVRHEHHSTFSTIQQFAHHTTKCIEVCTVPTMFRPKGQTQCICPRSQNTCQYIYWPKVNLYQVVVSQQSVQTLFKSLAQLFLYMFKKMAAGSHFGYPKITFHPISYHYRSIPQFLFCEFFLQNGCRRPFWMSEIHFRSHFWPFQIDR